MTCSRYHQPHQQIPPHAANKVVVAKKTPSKRTKNSQWKRTDPPKFVQKIIYKKCLLLQLSLLAIN
jgi:hypothetical protein